MRLRILVAALATLMVAPGAQAQQNPRTGDNDRILRPIDNEDSVRVTVVGRVEAVRQDGSFTVVSRRQSFAVLVPSGGFGRRPQVRVGERVRVTGELLENGRIATPDVDVLGGGSLPGRPSNVLSGTIRNINSDQQRLTLQTAEGLVRVDWDDQTEFVRNRNRDSVRGFRVGDSVRVVGRRQPGGDYLARRILFGGTAGWENGGVGEIISLNARQQTAEVDFDGQVETVDLRNATLRRQNRRLEIDDLRLGWDVRVQGTRQGRGSIQATTLDVVRQLDDDREPGQGQNLRTFEGTVEEINQENNAFRLRPAAGDVVRVQTNAETRVVRGATTVSFNTLRRGQRVRVRGRVTERENRNDVVEALRIEILQ